MKVDLSSTRLSFATIKFKYGLKILGKTGRDAYFKEFEVQRSILEYTKKYINKLGKELTYINFGYEHCMLHSEHNVNNLNMNTCSVKYI